MTLAVTLVVTLGMLVVVPLGLRLLPVVNTDRAARLHPVFAVAGVVALWLPRGALSTTLACWYGLGTLLLVALATRHAWSCSSRKAFRASDAAAITALACPAVAAFALVSVNDEVELLGAAILTAGMAWTHGLANAVGFALCALVAFTPMRADHEAD